MFRHAVSRTMSICMWIWIWIYSMYHSTTFPVKIMKKVTQYPWKGKHCNSVLHYLPEQCCWIAIAFIQCRKVCSLSRHWLQCEQCSCIARFIPSRGGNRGQMHVSYIITIAHLQPPLLTKVYEYCQRLPDVSWGPAGSSLLFMGCFSIVLASQWFAHHGGMCCGKWPVAFTGNHCTGLSSFHVPRHDIKHFITICDPPAVPPLTPPWDWIKHLLRHEWLAIKSCSLRFTPPLKAPHNLATEANPAALQCV